MIFLFPLLLFVGGWVSSHIVWWGISGVGGESVYSTYSLRGTHYLARWPTFFIFESRWKVAYGQLAPEPVYDDIQTPKNNFIGFCYKNEPFLDVGTSVIIGIPYWFSTTLTALLFLFIWRKTRGLLHPATAFPVEPSAAPSA